MRGIIYGKTAKSAEVKLQQIINDYEFYKIATVEKRDFNLKNVLFSNGDYWRALGPADISNTCGNRANVVYIDANITDEKILLSAKCTACAPPFQAIKYYYYGQE